LKTKYYISLGDNEDLSKVVQTTKQLILESLQVWNGLEESNKKSNLKYARTYSNMIAESEDSKGNKPFPNKRRCLLYLTELKEEGFLTTQFPVLVKFKEGNVASVRTFTRIK
jgi:hypothetical protein